AAVLIESRAAWQEAIGGARPVQYSAVRAQSYGRDVLASSRKPKVPEVTADPALVVEDASSGFCGELLRVEQGNAVLEDRHGRQRVFPLLPAGFLLEGKPVTLVATRKSPTAEQSGRSASGSVRVDGLRARTARESRIWVEGTHDAELVERIWGRGLRAERIVVEPRRAVVELCVRVSEFGPDAWRRWRVLSDHLVAASKESRLVSTVDSDDVLVTCRPYVDILETARPASVENAQWPKVPPETEW